MPDSLLRRLKSASANPLKRLCVCTCVGAKRRLASAGAKPLIYLVRRQCVGKASVPPLLPPLTQGGFVIIPLCNGQGGSVASGTSMVVRQVRRPARRDGARKHLPPQPRAGFQHPPGDRGFAPTALARPATDGGWFSRIPKTRICCAGRPGAPRFRKMAAPRRRSTPRKPGKSVPCAPEAAVPGVLAAAGGVHRPPAAPQPVFHQSPKWKITCPAP
jgi:hypothetical protein